MDSEVMEVNKQEKITTKQQLSLKIHINELHTNLSHPGDDIMYATVSHLDYNMIRILDVCEHFEI